MIKRTVYTLLACLLLGSLHAHAQGEGELIRSPQVADMIRYDHTPVALHSGRLDLNIPLLSLDDPDFHFPITAAYNSAGFVPNKPESSIGLNWSLSMGGIVYRERRGMPDDVNEDSSIKGFLHLLKDKKNYNPQSVAANPGQYISSLLLPHFKDSSIEASPDLYRFSFGPYSGSFSIGFDGKVHVSCERGGKLQVDLSGCEYALTTAATVIKITDDNGYCYYFGGSKDNMEYSLSYRNYTILYKGSNFSIDSYYLYKIVAPNGRTLDISYRKIPSFYHNNPARLLEELDYTSTLNAYTQNFLFTGSASMDMMNASISYGSGHYDVQNAQSTNMDYTLIKTALVDEVSCGAQKLKFHYSPRTAGKERFKNGLLQLGVRAGAMLDSISLSYNGSRVRSVKMGYTYQGGSYPAFFLTTLTLADGGKYLFSYDRRSFPDPLRSQTDYWNFLRSTDEGANGIPGVILYDNRDYIYSGMSREPNGSLCDVALLKQITFPAGGTADIAYEPHTYRQKVDRRASTSFKPALMILPANATAGGARVKSITHYGGNGTRTVAYEYTTSKGSQESSGILYYFPKYFRADDYHVEYGSNGPTCARLPRPILTYRNTGMNMPSYEQDHVRYGTVREVVVEKTTGGNRTIAFSVAYYSDVLTHLATLYIRKGVGTWTISGMKTGGSGTVYLKQNGVTKKTLSISETNSTTYVPDVADGEYEVYGIKTGVYGFTIAIAEPEEHEGFYKETRFTDYSTHPDSFLGDVLHNEISGVKPTDYDLNDNRLAQDRSRERGLPVSETSYDESNGRVVESTTYDYVNGEPGDSDYTYSANSCLQFLFQLNKTYYYPVLLKSKITRRYATDGTTGQTGLTERYTYNAEGYVKTQSSQESGLGTLTSTFTYPSDYPSDNACARMVALNMRAPVIGETRTRTSNVPAGKRLNVYALAGNLPVKAKEQSGTGATSTMVTQESRTHDAATGRITGKQYRDGTKEAYLWSYGHNYIVAKVEGAGYDEVKAVLGASFLESLGSNLNPSAATIEGIRTSLKANASLWNRMLLTTYIYYPLKGIASMTAPNGEKRTYAYDEAGRLTEVKGHDGNSIGQYEYHYK